MHNKIAGTKDSIFGNEILMFYLWMVCTQVPQHQHETQSARVSNRRSYCFWVSKRLACVPADGTILLQLSKLTSAFFQTKFRNLQNLFRWTFQKSNWENFKPKVAFLSPEVCFPKMEIWTKVLTKFVQKWKFAEMEIRADFFYKSSQNGIPFVREWTVFQKSRWGKGRSLSGALLLVGTSDF